jgi:hypothetical protein
VSCGIIEAIVAARYHGDHDLVCMCVCVCACMYVSMRVIKYACLYLCIGMHA